MKIQPAVDRVVDTEQDQIGAKLEHHFASSRWIGDDVWLEAPRAQVMAHPLSGRKLSLDY